MSLLLEPLAAQSAIRFTNKGDALYAIVLGIPQKEVRIAIPRGGKSILKLVAASARLRNSCIAD